MKILVADNLDSAALSELGRVGFQLIAAKGLKASALPEGANQAEILVVRSTLVPAPAMDLLPALKLIIRAGAGTDTIDVAAALARGIQVSNCPGKNADAVAEMALGLLLAADRRIVEATLALRRGEWTKGALGQGLGLKGRTLGIIGLGQVGSAMARKAKGLEMRVLAYSRTLTPESARAAGVDHIPDLESLARASDAVSVHVALTPETRSWLGKGFFSAMRDGALFVNTSRGEVVDREALIEAIRAKGLRVGLDVFAGEPKVAEALFQDVELASLATCTPHLAASTDQAAQAVGAEVVRIATAFKASGLAPNGVAGP